MPASPCKYQSTNRRPPIGQVFDILLYIQWKQRGKGTSQEEAIYMGNGKRLAINLISNLLAFTIQFGVNLFLTPYIINSLGSEAYSFIPLTNNIIGYITIINVAFYSMTGRFVSVALNQGNTKQANIYFNSSTAANCALTIFLLIPSTLLILYVNKILIIPDNLFKDVQITFFFSLLSMNISMALASFGAVYFVKNRVDLSARRNIEGNIIRVVLLVSLFIVFQPKIYFINATMFVVTLYSCGANLYYTKKMMPEIILNRKYVRKSAIKTLLSSGIWNSVNELSTVLLTTLDLLLANLLAGSLASGNYSVAKTVPNFVQSIISVLIAVFVPQLTIYFAQHKKKEMLHNISFSVKLIGAFTAIPVGFLLAAGQDFFHLWVPTQNANLLHGLSILTLIPLAITSCTSIINNVFTVTNNLKVPSLVLLFCGIINTLGVIILMKCTPLGIWAIPAVALVTGIGRSFFFAPMYAAHCLHTGRKTFYPSIIRGISCTIVMTIITFVYGAFLPTNNWIALILCGIVCAILSSLINLKIIFTNSERTYIYNIFKNKIKSYLHK